MKKLTRIIMLIIAAGLLISPLPVMADGSGGGNCIELKGSGEHVLVESLDTLPSFTLELWAKYTAETYAPYNTLLCFGQYHPDFGMYYGKPYLDGGAMSSTYPERNVWTHLAVSYNGSSHTSIVYMNGKQYGAKVYEITTGGEGMGIGFSPWESYSSFYGEIDEVRVWNTVLGQPTIRTWMNKELTESHPNITDDGGNNLVGYWKLDETSGNVTRDYADDISSAAANDGTWNGTSVDKWILSTAPVGDKCHFGTGTSNLTENADVPVDISWDEAGDPGSGAIFSAIQVDEGPGVTTGLPASYAPVYWEVWLEEDDGSYQADVSFHYDDISGIEDESQLALYTRTEAGGSWTEVSGYTVYNEGNNTDGTGYITAENLAAFSQFIIAGSGIMVSPVPEYPALVLLGSGLVVVAGYFWFRQRRQAAIADK